MEQARAAESKLSAEARTLEAELGAMEKAVPPSKEFGKLRESLDEIAEQRATLREQQAKLNAQTEIARAKNDKAWSALPLSKIIEAVEESQKNIHELWKILESAAPDLARVKALVGDLRTWHESLVSKLQQPAPEPVPRGVYPEQHRGARDDKGSLEVTKEADNIARQIGELAKRAAAVQAELDDWSKKEEGKRSHLFETQRKLNQKRAEAQQAERKANESAVELARWETRRDAFLAELRQHNPDWEKTLNALAQDVGQVENAEQLLPRLTRVRSQLEWIGSIDPETEREHAETKTRFEFLSTQTEDLRGAIQGLGTVIEELDETIRTRSETAFHAMDREFGKFFRLLFGGGEAKLVQLEAETEEDEEGNLVEPESEGIAGIEIQATPPGKRLKNMALLSGGERALTSLELICSIMATHQSPFVVLDEVDAALDESNSKKFADILSQLSDKTQFIVVTHNRATMQQGTVLYGVTLAEDGTSQLLSVKLEEVSG